MSKLQKRFPGAIFKIDATKQREAASAYGVMDAAIAGFLAGDGAA